MEERKIEDFILEGPDTWLHDVFGTVIIDGNKKYMYLPYWVELNTDTDRARLHRLGNIPDELKKLIEEFRYEER